MEKAGSISYCALFSCSSPRRADALARRLTYVCICLFFSSFSSLSFSLAEGALSMLDGVLRTGVLRIGIFPVKPTAMKIIPTMKRVMKKMRTIMVSFSLMLFRVMN